MPPKRYARNRILIGKKRQRSTTELDQNKRKAESTLSTKRFKSEIIKTSDKDIGTPSEILPTDTKSTVNSIEAEGHSYTSEADGAKDGTVSHKGHKKEINSLASKDVNCSICLDTQNYSEFNFLPCGHRFYSLCVENWMAIKTTCPMCKTNVIDMDVPELGENSFDSDDDAYSEGYEDSYDEDSDDEEDDISISFYDTGAFSTIPYSTFIRELNIEGLQTDTKLFIKNCFVNCLFS